ncbi:MAG: hypothetical protein AUJ47_09315 [Candidatus Marinimicrobia bacterium CG1_02_48_14]|nr:MAG: hypothetical protein AUJ47_09315 [Candidatus Marinimicrobia bacterium CG1_02_48_14]
MRRVKITTTTISAFTLLLIFSFIYLVGNFYRIALTRTQTAHQEQQLDMAEAAARGIRFYTAQIQHEMTWLATLSQQNSETTPFPREGADEPVKAWFFANNDFEVTSQWGVTLPKWTQSEISGLYRLPQNGCQFTSVFPFTKDDPATPFYFIAIMPLRNSADTTIATGYLGALISFDWLMQKFIAPLKLTQNDFAWVMDGSGRLIYHPNHEEMLLRSTKEIREDCMECHSSFEFQDNMIKSGSGVGEYFIQGESEKIMAYAPITLLNQRWVVAISTDHPAMVQSVMSTLLPIFILSGIFLLLLIAAGLALYYLNLKRARATEAQKHFQQVQKIQEKLDQAAKLASIGELVDSVAHEINTPTGIIATVTDGILLSDCAQMACAADLGVIKKQVRRIKTYTKSLLAFSRRMPFQPEPNDMIELIEECLFLVSPRIRANRVEVVRELPATFPKFTFDRPRVEQVIINLLNNAIDFVEAPGRITLKLETVLETDSQEEKMAVLTISDNGKGIADADLPNIFEPFYSTKPLSKGTGLGLSISKSIIERHNGQIKIKTKQNQGTSFMIYLPQDGDAV